MYDPSNLPSWQRIGSMERAPQNHYFHFFPIALNGNLMYIIVVSFYRYAPPKLLLL
jgi:hypothetical protein